MSATHLQSNGPLVTVEVAVVVRLTDAVTGGIAPVCSDDDVIDGDADEDVGVDVEVVTTSS